jgi:hypothetical protein
VGGEQQECQGKRKRCSPPPCCPSASTLPLSLPLRPSTPAHHQPTTRLTPEAVGQAARHHQRQRVPLPRRRQHDAIRDRQHDVGRVGAGGAAREGRGGDEGELGGALVCVVRSGRVGSSRANVSVVQPTTSGRRPAAATRAWQPASNCNKTDAPAARRRRGWQRRRRGRRARRARSPTGGRGTPPPSPPPRPSWRPRPAPIGSGAAAAAAARGGPQLPPRTAGGAGVLVLLLLLLRRGGRERQRGGRPRRAAVLGPALPLLGVPSVAGTGLIDGRPAVGLPSAR